jgi:hypothetical protein
MKATKRGSVCDADDGRSPWGGSQKAIEVCLGLFVQGRRGFIQKYKGGLQNQDSGKCQALLFTRRKSLRPVLFRTELADEFTETYLI